MSKFYYIVHASTSDNVGELDADDKKAALKKLEEIFGKPTDLLSFELINKASHDSEGRRIAKERQQEANVVAIDQDKQATEEN